MSSSWDFFGRGGELADVERLFVFFVLFVLFECLPLLDESVSLFWLSLPAPPDGFWLCGVGGAAFWPAMGAPVTLGTMGAFPTMACDIWFMHAVR